jgi:hypothetical protein
MRNPDHLAIIFEAKRRKGLVIRQALSTLGEESFTPRGRAKVNAERRAKTQAKTKTRAKASVAKVDVAKRRAEAKVGMPKLVVATTTGAKLRKIAVPRARKRVASEVRTGDPAEKVFAAAPDNVKRGNGIRKGGTNTTRVSSYPTYGPGQSSRNP